MSVLFPSDSVWNAANWVARNFFEDALPLAREGSFLAKELEFCVKAQLETLDMEAAPDEAFGELAAVVDKVIARNRQLNGANFHDPAGFPVYMAKLGELRDLAQRHLARAVS